MSHGFQAETTYLVPILCIPADVWHQTFDFSLFTLEERMRQCHTVLQSHLRSLMRTCQNKLVTDFFVCMCLCLFKCWHLCLCKDLFVPFCMCLSTGCLHLFVCLDLCGFVSTHPFGYGLPFPCAIFYFYILI